MTPGKPRKIIRFFSADYFTGRQPSVWRPNMDVYETADAVVAALEVPGVRREDLEVIQHGNRIVVRGVRHASLADKPQRFHQIEIVCGAFEREILLPESLASTHVQANLLLGILSLRIPKQPAAGDVGEHRIEIEGQ